MKETDRWLDRWLPLIKEKTSTVLELGCNTGRDTARLAEAGLRVVGTDISAEALQECARVVPATSAPVLVRHDLREPFPFADGSFDVIVASLCLHYFGWDDTCRIAGEILRCLSPGGLLLCRLNSTRDVHYGATGFQALEPNYYQVDGRYIDRKRFFDRAAIDALFGAEWTHVAVEEMTIARYEKPKCVWEVVLRKAARS